MRARWAVPPRCRAGLVLAGTVAAIAVAHTVLRGDRWAYEWRWAAFQYQLVVLLVAPVVAAASAWEAVALRAAADGVRASGRAVGFAVAVVVRTIGWTALGLAVGSLAVVAAIWRARGPGLPPLEALDTIGPAGAQLVAVAVTSYALAAAWPRVAVVPVLAVGWFAGLIAANVLLPEEVARVGGATASLLALHVPPSVQVLQIAAAGSVAVFGLAVAWARSVATTPAAPRAVVVAIPLAVLCLLVAVAPAVGPLFVRRTPATVCTGSAPTWCLAEEYRGALDDLEVTARPVFAVLDEVGAARPERIQQGLVGQPTVEELLFGAPELHASAIVYAWMPPGCWAGLRSALLDDLSRWATYVETRLASERPPATGDEATELRAAAERIRSCVGG